MSRGEPRVPCDPFTPDDAEELQRRNYSEITTRKYLRVVSDFAKHFGKSPDKLGPNELRTYQAARPLSVLEVATY
jgi:hypothetical protein